MYNHDQKVRFIRSYTASLSLARRAENLFTVTEPYEEAWGCDLCSKNAEELQPVIEGAVGMRSSSIGSAMAVFRAYGKWCIASGVVDACDGLLNVRIPGIDKIRHQMVSSPLHLQRYLDTIFTPESMETIDNIYRCFFWLAFMGIEEESIYDIVDSDVDFTAMTITVGFDSYKIYQESAPAFHNAVHLKSFRQIHARYETNRDRIDGHRILRGIKSQTDKMTIRSMMSKYTSEQYKKGITDTHLSYQRAKLSGLFFRVYELELAGFPADFSKEAIRITSGKSYKNQTVEERQKIIQKELMEDYQRWKIAFAV